MAEPARAPRRIWRTWLILALAFQGLGGYAVAFAYARLPTLGWHRAGVARALWGREDFPAEAEPFRDFAMALLGATMASWAVALLFVAAVPFARGERWSWWCLSLSLLAWFPVDTGLSLAHGVGVNALFNLGALAMVGIPLVATWPLARAGPPNTNTADA